MRRGCWRVGGWGWRGSCDSDTTVTPEAVFPGSAGVSPACPDQSAERRQFRRKSRRDAGAPRKEEMTMASPRQATVFYSWQSDLPNKTNRGLIEAALSRALKELHEAGEFETEHIIDRDTKGAPGSPDIAAIIFKKIEDSSVFVADVSIIVTSPSGRSCPNPNVLIELGYALSSLGPDNLILVCNTAFGNLEDLPFDLRGKRISAYRLASDEEPAAARQRLTQLFHDALSEIARHKRRSATFKRNTEFATTLVSALVRAQLFGNEIKARRVNPWLDQISDVFGNISLWLRENSHRSAAIELDLAENIESLAFVLDDVRSHVHTAGGGREFNAKVMSATQAAAELQARVTSMGELTEEARAEIISVIVDQHKQLAGWIRRTKGQDLYRTELYSDFISAVVEVGYQLAKLSYYPLEGLEGDSARSLRGIGEALHLIDLKDEMNRGPEAREAIVGFVAETELKLRHLIVELGLEE